MPLEVSAVTRSHVGLVRSGNEDSGYAGRTLFVIADGMGGHAAGEVASRTVVAALIGLDGTDLGADPGATLRGAVLEANERVRLAVAARPDLDGMGTTLTALAWDGERLALAHVGDSRGYLLRDGELSTLTRDQSLVQALIDEGRLTADEARSHPQRSVILQALDGRPDVEPVITTVRPRAGDRYLLCSDGLTDFVDDPDITEAATTTDPAAAVDALIALALDAGAPDNVTVVLLDVSDSTAAAGPDEPADAATHELGGVLVGAVGETDAVTEPPPALAAADTDSGSSGAGAETSTTADAERAEDDEAGSRRRRWPWFLLVLVLAVGAVGYAVRAWVQDQWYVGVDNGMVAVFSGIDVSLGPVSLSHLEQRTTLETATLPEFQRERVEQGIQVEGPAAAARTVVELQAAADDCLRDPTTAGCP